MSGSTFETLLAPSLDLMEMKQMGNMKTRRVQVNPESGTSFALSGTSTQDVFFSFPSGGKHTFINGANSYLTFDITMACSTAGVNFGPCSGDFNAVVRTLETTNQGTTIEQIDRYNVLSSMFSDLTNEYRSMNMLNILQGGVTSTKVGAIYTSAMPYCRPVLPIYSAFLWCVMLSIFASD